MRQRCLIALFSLLLGFFLFVPFCFGQTALRIILDTDISSDVDDAGAVAVLHSLAAEGKIRILAMMASSGDPWSVPCLRAFNAWFKRDRIPVGQVKDKAVTHVSKYTEQIAREFGTTAMLNQDIPDAVALYRKILSRQPPHSVIIITVGYLTNLSSLLASQPDQLSPLSGRDLVAQKVKKLVTMGGQYPQGREWNFYQDAKAAGNVVENWPTPIDFVGFELGMQVMTGAGLPDGGEDPVSRAYQLYNGKTDRPSWDQVAVLAGSMPAPSTGKSYFKLSKEGANTVAQDGGNTWNEKGKASHRYVKLTTAPTELADMIERRMRAAITGRLE